MTDNLQELQELIIDFREKRDWGQFHKIKDLVIGLNIEASELAELFLWKREDEMKLIDKSLIENEIADVFVYIVYICYEYNIDLNKAVRAKININSQKYPVDKSKGSNKKYTELRD